MQRRTEATKDSVQRSNQRVEQEAIRTKRVFNVALDGILPNQDIADRSFEERRTPGDASMKRSCQSEPEGSNRFFKTDLC